ncbi:MAG: TetR/AcrR family transcriptional regulator [Rhodospirillum sp.]|nr:TetR/AcrR family transcriptional regulator [Rhodospirillum sp.]MCF8489050.1 TetR/AcrR family transcriptional regulator [Rhodospirillum sp.]MCF8499761.1 TetR/AcrR family transcriptional regulator [Rhodospirillum sp.]
MTSSDQKVSTKGEGASAWIKAALRAMARDGISAVRVEVLAKELGVTKGGFYWHFKDRADLLSRLLEDWREGRAAAVRAVTEPKEGETPRDGLIRLLMRQLGNPNQRGLATELAIRDWARNDPQAAAVVEQVDAERSTRVISLFIAAGMDPVLARTRAWYLYSLLFGQALVTPPAEGTASIESLAKDAVDMLLRTPCAGKGG